MGDTPKLKRQRAFRFENKNEPQMLICSDFNKLFGKCELEHPNPVLANNEQVSRVYVKYRIVEEKDEKRNTNI